MQNKKEICYVADYFKRQPISTGYCERRGLGADGVRKAVCICIIDIVNNEL